MANDQAAFDAIVTSIQNNSSETSIVLETAGINNADCISLGAALVNNISVQQLNLGSNSISDSGVSALATALTSNTSLRALYLYNNAISSSGASALATALTNNTVLKVLFLDTNSIGDSGVIALANALQINKSLSNLDLSYNPIGDISATTLIAVLQNNYSILMLSYNSTVPVGTSISVDNLTKLNTLITRNINFPSILQNLQNNSITTLDLTSQPIGDMGVALLAKALKRNTSLTYLNLSSTQITAVGITAITEMLKINTSLQALYLYGNSIGDSGAIILAEALKSNKALKILDLGNNQINHDGVTDIADALKINTVLQTLFLNINSIGDSGANSLTSALQVNTVLTYLDLKNNFISNSSYSNLFVAVQNNFVLTSLVMDPNPYSAQINPLLLRNQQYPIFTANQLRITQSAPGPCSIVLTSDNLQVVDYNNIPRNFMFNVTDVEHGFFIPGNQFTQSQLNNGTVRFLYDGMGTPAYNITASNGNFSTPNPRSGTVSFIPYLATTTRPFTVTPTTSEVLPAPLPEISCIPVLTSTSTFSASSSSATPTTNPSSSLTSTSTTSRPFTVTRTPTTQAGSSSSSAALPVNTSTTTRPFTVTQTPALTIHASSSSSSAALPMTSSSTFSASSSSAMPTTNPSTTEMAIPGVDGAKSSSMGGMIGGIVAGFAVIGAAAVVAWRRYWHKQSAQIGILPQADTLGMTQNPVYAGSGSTRDSGALQRTGQPDPRATLRGERDERPALCETGQQGREPCLLLAGGIQDSMKQANLLMIRKAIKSRWKEAIHSMKGHCNGQQQ